MWSYYGSKTNIVDYYPAPKFDKIIEPFAGAAKYSLKYFEKEVLLVDKYEVIVKIWKYLQCCSQKDILSMPRMLKKGQTLDDFIFDCEEQKMLMGFLIVKGAERPRKSSTDWVILDRPNFTNHLVKKIANDLYKIKHWKIELDSYENIPNQKATWFIDPPYQFGGHSYPKNNKKIDFNHLANWSKERLGQTMVCENMKSNWLDFKPMKKHYGRKGIQEEGIWTNTPTIYDNIQQKLII